MANAAPCQSRLTSDVKTRQVTTEKLHHRRCLQLIARKHEHAPAQTS